MTDLFVQTCSESVQLGGGLCSALLFTLLPRYPLAASTAVIIMNTGATPNAELSVPATMGTVEWGQKKLTQPPTKMTRKMDMPIQLTASGMAHPVHPPHRGLLYSNAVASGFRLPRAIEMR